MVSNDLSPKIYLPYWRLRLEYFPQIAMLGIFVSVIARFTTFDSLRQLLALTMMQIIGFFLIYLYWLNISKWLIFIDRAKLSLLEIMSIGASGGLILAGSQTFLGWIFQEAPLDSFAYRSAGNMAIAAFWLPIQSVAVGNFRKYSRLKSEIREEYLLQESVQLARRRALDEYKVKIEENIQEQLTITTGEAQKLFSALSSRDSHRLPEYLRIISDEYFRLAAHKLDSKIKAAQPRFMNLRRNSVEMRQAIALSIRRRPLNPSWFTLVLVATVTVPLTAKADYLLIFEILAVIGVSSFIIQYLLLRSFLYIKKRFVFATIVATVANIVIPLALVRLIPSNTPELGNGFAFVFVVMVVTGIGHISQAGIVKAEELRALSLAELSQVKNDEREQNELFSKITRDWAKYIHGNFTTKLESAALALETATANNDYEGAEQAIIEVEKTLKLDSLRSRSNPLILGDEIKERCANWQGLIDINITSQISADVSISASIRDVGTCIEEAILNAVRHGDCSTIDIDISEESCHMNIRISNNGAGFTGKPKGFGSSVYEEATRGDWKLWRDEKKKSTILELNFAKI